MSGETRTISRIVEDDAWVADVLEHLEEQRDMLRNVLEVVRGNRALAEANAKAIEEIRRRRWWRFGR